MVCFISCATVGDILWSGEAVTQAPGWASPSAGHRGAPWFLQSRAKGLAELMRRKETASLTGRVPRLQADGTGNAGERHAGIPTDQCKRGVGRIHGVALWGV